MDSWYQPLISDLQSTWILVTRVNIALSRQILAVYDDFSLMDILFKIYSASILLTIKIIQYYSIKHRLYVLFH